MNYTEFSKKIKTKYPQYADMDDYELAQKMVTKYPKQYADVTFDKIENKKGIDLTPSGLMNTATNALYSAVKTPYKMIRYNQPAQKAFTDAYKEAKHIRQNLETRHPVLSGIQKAGLDTLAYSKLPMTKIKPLEKLGNIGNTALTGLYQGAIAGGLEAMKENVDNTLKGVGEGATAGAGLGVALPGSLKLTAHAMKLVPYTSKAIGKTVGRISPKTLEQAMKPESKALDMTPEQAEKALIETTERVRSGYQNLLDEAGERVNAVAKKTQGRVNASDLKDDIINTFSDYQKDYYNPARSATGNLEKELLDEVDSIRFNKENEILQGLNDDFNKQLNTIGGYLPEKEREAFDILSRVTGTHPKYLRMQLNSRGLGGKRGENIGFKLEDSIYNKDYATTKLADTMGEYKYYADPNIDKVTMAENAYNDIINRNFYEPIEPLQTAIYVAERGYNNLAKNLLSSSKNENAYNTFINQVENYSKNLPDELADEYLTKAYNLMDKVGDVDKLSAYDLQGMNQRIGKMTDWSDATAKDYYNPIIEQISGKFAGRLNRMSPEMAQANKQYENLASFMKNDGINQILRGNLQNAGKLGNAPTTLKNYNSMITKGNAARNIQDLERTLVDAGNEPFLNTIDDINAVMDFNNTRTTGDSISANIINALSKPALKLTKRVINSNFPQQYNLFSENLPRFITPLSVRLLDYDE